MTVDEAPPAARASLPVDVAVLAGRHLRLMSRRPASIFGAIVLPLVFAVLFFAVFGKVVERHIDGDYGQYVLPAVLLQAMLFTAMSAAILTVEDITGGLIRRLRSMAVASGAPPLGLVTAELARAVLTTAVLLIAGLALGFALHGGVAASIGFVLLGLGFGAAACTGFVALAFALGKLESVQLVTNLIFFPFLLVSNAFTPTEAFPEWLRPFVANQPLSRTADALRALASADDALAEPVAVAVAWVAALLVVCAIGATVAYRRAR
ncbi:ABC transporter permease [Nocardia bovistercoris]|uniref:Transport permease protein n=1 Tax=Nocardia bovistercoris TaxID=2785916 RepID=A0A931N641_9NOCA|nr:ABC transporter permease [Nocardia bovistercoris]MBH0779303.1 ABC transporter permease [Nocardia bovistercoris]